MTAPLTGAAPTATAEDPAPVGKDVFDVRDRIVVLTGGLGRLGGSFCRSLLARGARVAVLDVVTPSGDARCRLLGTSPDHHLLTFEADVTCPHDLRRVCEIVEATWGAPHALVNAAGIDSPPSATLDENGPFETYPIESFERILDVNTKGSFLAAQLFGAAMARAGRGSIVNVGSIYGFVSPDQRIYAYRATCGRTFTKPVAYSVSKSAIYGLTRYLATYWAPAGVRVNAVTLGGVFDDQDPEFLDGYTSRVPMGRMADPGEYDGAIVFLISDASSYMTGANLVLDGGFTAW